MRRYLLSMTLSAGLLVAPVVVARPAVAATSPGHAVTWGTCPPPGPGAVRDPRMECATIRVPLDYRHLRGRTIEIAISRIQTATAGLRRGVLLSNPGGPGVSDLDMPSEMAAGYPPDLLTHYDLIGFDPRGIGSSTPISCGLGPNVPADLNLPYPAPDGSITRNIAFARTTAAGCAAHSGDLLPYITTANTARDMDAIRAALGEPKLSFYGVSYGTYLGAVYTTLFPQHTDRMVLDSAIDPGLVWHEMWRSWNEAVALRLPDFTKWAAAHDATYHLGPTPGAVTRTYYRLAARLDRHPVTLPDGTVATGNYLRELTRRALYFDDLLPGLAQGWRFLATGTGTPPTMQLQGDNQNSVMYAIACNDVAWARNPGHYARDVAADRRHWPATAGMPGNIWPCAFWPNKPIEPPVTVTDRGPRNVLIAQQTRDPSTSLRSALGLRRALGHRAAMVTVDAGGHVTIGRGTCADTIAVSFLVTGALPAHDQFCAGPTAGDPSSTRTRTVPPRL
jgi:pimeloyl-ACP methyl ester carboxylesterase